jgi:hypothetical protein
MSARSVFVAAIMLIGGFARAQDGSFGVLLGAQIPCLGPRQSHLVHRR